MDRRFFLRAGLIGTAAAFIAPRGLFTKSLMRTTESSRHNILSLSILSEKPDEAAVMANVLLNNFPPQKFIVEESYMNGSYIGDIAFIYDNRLVDFRKSNDIISRKLRDIATKLNLPSELKNPVLLNIRSASNNIKPLYVNLFKSDMLAERIPVSENHKELALKGDRGELHFSIENGIVRAADSSCRHKTCVRTGGISEAGKSIVCIPNRFRISLV